MRRYNHSVDALYEMAMQRIGDLRCDAARGRDLKNPTREPDGRAIEPVVTTSSTICSQHAATTLSHLQR